jgi:hypothetical protein
MHVRYRLLSYALVLLGAAFVGRVALAGVLVARNYPVGTNVTYAFKGVTLGYAVGSGATFATSPHLS